MVEMPFSAVYYNDRARQHPRIRAFIDFLSRNIEPTPQEHEKRGKKGTKGQAINPSGAKPSGLTGRSLQSVPRSLLYLRHPDAVQCQLSDLLCRGFHTLVDEGSPK